MYNDVQKRATAKYMRTHLDDIKIRVPKGKRDEYKEIAAKLGLSVNQLFIKAVEYYAAEQGIEVQTDKAE